MVHDDQALDSLVAWPDALHTGQFKTELLPVPLTFHGQSEAKCSELFPVPLTFHGQSEAKCSELLSVPLNIHEQSEA